MNRLILVFTQLRRHLLRSLLTAGAITVAFLLYGYLSAVRVAFTQGVRFGGEHRLLVRHRTSIAQLLPYSYKERIKRLNGVVDVLPETWFGGVYQDPKNFFGQLAVEPETFLRVYPEYVVSSEVRERWLRTKIGAVVGERTANRFGWSVGDRIVLRSSIWPKRDGSRDWEFEIVGIYKAGTPETDRSLMFFRYDYLDETRLYAKGWVGWFMVKVDNPQNAATVAFKIDREFENSYAETRTEPERAFLQSQSRQIGDIGRIVTLIVGAVFVTVLVIVGNTMASSTRERLREFAVLIALGFPYTWVISLVVLEACTLVFSSGLFGLMLAWLLVRRGDPTGMLSAFYISTKDVFLSGLWMSVLVIVASISPIWLLIRLPVAKALRWEAT